MNYTWVIGVFTGERARSVKAHADSGIGYFIREERGRGVGYEVEAAFRRANDSPMPPELVECNNNQIDILERKYATRHGLKPKERKRNVNHIGGLIGQRALPKTQ